MEAIGVIRKCEIRPPGVAACVVAGAGICLQVQACEGLGLPICDSVPCTWGGAWCATLHRLCFRPIRRSYRTSKLSPLHTKCGGGETWITFGAEGLSPRSSFSEVRRLLVDAAQSASLNFATVGAARSAASTMNRPAAGTGGAVRPRRRSLPNRQHTCGPGSHDRGALRGMYCHRERPCQPSSNQPQ